LADIIGKDEMGGHVAGRDHLEDIQTDGRKILEWILEK
jgi:hypothetical protein